MDYRIISIGALAVHDLWEHQGEARTPHATTTLVRSGDHRILVNPGLPGPAIAARLGERSGLSPEDISDVFLTSFMPDHRSGIEAFPNARWLVTETERETVGRMLVERFGEEEDPDAKDLLRREIAILQRCKPAPDRIAPHVDLFPLHGFTAGSCGLLLSEPRRTVLIAGGAIGTSEHLEQGRVLRNCYDIEAAQESFKEAIEIADVLVPGYDNILLNPTRAR